MANTNGVLINVDHRPGYGGPECWIITVIYENHVLEETAAGSERSLGQVEAALEAKWNNLTRPELDEAIKGKKLASPWCDVCGKATFHGGSYCLGKNFCEKCAGQIPCLQKEYSEEQERLRVQVEQKHALEMEARLKDCKTGFHWRNGWFFRREKDGSVRVAQGDAGYVLFTVDKESWASIVASVSSGGEGSGRWDRALKFHEELS